MSFEAFIGVLLACEKDKEWKIAFDVMLAVMQKERTSRWLRDGSTLDIPQNQTSTKAEQPFPSKDATVAALEVFMRTCNASGQFGVALLGAQLFSLLYTGGAGRPMDFAGSSISQLLTSIASKSSSPAELLATSVASLCGAHSRDAAREIAGMLVDSSSHPTTVLIDVSALHQYASFEETGYDWSELWGQMSNTVQYFFALKDSGVQLSEEDQETASFALCKLLRQLSAARGADAGIPLLFWLMDLKLSDRASLSGQSLVKTIGSSSILQLSDSLLSVTMEVMAQHEGNSTALDLYEASRQDDQTCRILSSIAALNALFEGGRKEETFRLFELVLARVRNPDLFRVMATKLFESGEHDAVTGVYKLALSSGCMSESLNLLTIHSVSRLGSTKRIIIQQEIANEAGQLAGDELPSQWVARHYWNLKKRIRKGELSKLLLWYDQNTDLDELQLALDILKAKSELGCAPHIESLQTIAIAGSRYHADYVPSDKRHIPLVPKSRDEWYKIINGTLTLAEETKLSRDSRFMSHMVIALVKLGCVGEPADLVNRCLSRGILLEEPALDQVTSGVPESEAIIQAKNSFSNLIK